MNKNHKERDNKSSLPPYKPGEIQRTSYKVPQHEKPLSFEIFKKTPEEKAALKIAKLQWRAAMKVLHKDFTKRNAFNFSQSNLR